MKDCHFTKEYCQGKFQHSSFPTSFISCIQKVHHPCNQQQQEFAFARLSLQSKTWTATSSWLYLQIVGKTGWNFD